MSLDIMHVLAVLVPSLVVWEKGNTLWHSMHKELTVIGELFDQGGSDR